MRRVVVTGLGMVTPLGCGVDATWSRILAGRSGARRIETFEVSDLSSQIACVVPRGDGSEGTFNPDQWMEPKDQRDRKSTRLNSSHSSPSRMPSSA